MKKIYSYVLRYDDGGAPNPYGGLCTLAICKPQIRRNAEIGDWVVGTGSKNARCNDGNTYDLSNHLTYAMKITDVKSFKEYDDFCNSDIPSKIPIWSSKVWPEKMGDCIYDYNAANAVPLQRAGVHKLVNMDHDLNGKNVLLSNHFYYFGEAAIEIPDHLETIIKRHQGHRKITNTNIIFQFEEWISKYESNKLYGEPQLKHEFNKHDLQDIRSLCAIQCNRDDNFEVEESIC